MLISAIMALTVYKTTGCTDDDGVCVGGGGGSGDDDDNARSIVHSLTHTLNTHIC